MTDPTTTNATSATPPSGAGLPPDPAQYDARRNEIARQKGLEQPYIAGGEDPELQETLRRERPYVVVLVWMIAIIIALGFVLGFIGAIIGTPR
jgi:hypothetical protein